MKRVVVESPYAGDVLGNIAYARLALADSLARGEAPIAAHLLHTQVLDDEDLDQRARGIRAGLRWIEVADLVAVYEDHGVSPGMEAALQRARECGVPVEFRRLERGSG